MNIEKTHSEETSNIDDLFEQAARNQGYASLQEMIEVSSWLETTEIDPDTLSELDDDVSYIATPKPEFKEKYEAWLEERRHRLSAIKNNA